MSRESLSLIKYRFTLEAVDPITLPAYKGSAFHGGFGHALMQISPTWYRYFFESGPGNKTDWPKPFVILPPLEETENYQPGDRFHCELTLFGEATQHYAIAQAAMEYLGMQMGLGIKKGRYKVVEVFQASISDKEPNTSLSSIDIENYRAPSLPKDKITIHFLSRLMLKNDNKIYTRPPQFELLFQRLSGRIKTLEQAYGELDCKNNRHCFKELSIKAKEIEIIDNTLEWHDWQRYSGRQQKQMSFGGLLGSVTYKGDLSPFLAELALGEWIHIGNKTSFGFGKYIIS